MGDMSDEIRLKIGGNWNLHRSENFEAALEAMGKMLLRTIVVFFFIIFVVCSFVFMIYLFIYSFMYIYLLID